MVKLFPFYREASALEMANGELYIVERVSKNIERIDYMTI